MRHLALIALSVANIYSHKTASLQKINHYGLVYTLPGSDSSLSPILFAAHQDVVPATSLDKWTHPPFQAHFDGHLLYGRGASDCKNNLIGLLSVLESLIDQKWTPRRSVILAFGFDEEIGGERGAKHIADYLERKYGRHGVAMVVDEGGMGIEAVGDYAYALPAVAEKGFLDIHLKLEVAGGHSSRPPAHSGIGILAEMIVALEAHPFPPRLTHTNPFRRVLECQVRYSPREVEKWLQRALVDGEDELALGKKLADARGGEVRFSMQTSQAVTVIGAGNATNQLPETVEAIVNYRIAPHDSIDGIKSHVAELLAPFARKHGLGLRTKQEYGEFVPALYISSTDDLDPSPITPTGRHEKVWQLFGGTVRQVFEDVPALKGKTIVPVGDIMTGKYCSCAFFFQTVASPSFQSDVTSALES